MRDTNRKVREQALLDAALPLFLERGIESVSIDDITQTARTAKGKVTSTEGSFHAGVQGAQPGVFMQAAPQIGRWFRQEWYAGQAEDRFKILQRRARVTVPYGSFSNALRAEERTHLEPDVVDNKYYVRGVGEVFEGAVKGPQEILRLVEIIS